MKKIPYFVYFLIFLAACASKNTDWDSGASKTQGYRDEQRQEQVDSTNMQFTSPGRSGPSQNQTF